jgi:hypothetical protein
MKRLIASIIVTLLGHALLACGDDNEIDRTFDCGSICSRYSECVTDIDVGECTDYCEDQAEADPNVEQAADACDDCIEDKSCAESSACIPDCSLVPITT